MQILNIAYELLPKIATVTSILIQLEAAQMMLEDTDSKCLL